MSRVLQSARRVPGRHFLFPSYFLPSVFCFISLDFFFPFSSPYCSDSMPALSKSEVDMALIVVWLTFAFYIVFSELPPAYFRAKRRRLPRISTQFVDDLLHVFLEDQFISNVGTNRECFQLLCGRLEPYLRTERKRIPLEKKVLLTLYHMRHRDTNEQISNLFDIAKGAVSEYMSLVMTSIKLEFGNEVKFPTTEQELATQRAGFKQMYGVPCVGLIDGLHIRIQSSRTDWLNYKSFKSVLSILVCNYDGTFSYLTSGYPGSFNDAGAIQDSWFWEHGWKYLARGGDYLLGDSIFPLRSYLLALYDWSSMPQLTRNQRLFQRRMARTRSLVERSFARLYKRFPILYNCLRATSLQRCLEHIETAVILHNVFCRWNDPWGVVGAPMHQPLDAEDVAAIRRINYRGAAADGARRRDEVMHSVLGLRPHESV